MLVMRPSSKIRLRIQGLGCECRGAHRRHQIYGCAPTREWELESDIYRTLGIGMQFPRILPYLSPYPNIGNIGIGKPIG